MPRPTARGKRTEPLPIGADLKLQAVARLIAAVYWRPIQAELAKCQGQAQMDAPEAASDEPESRCYGVPVE